MELSWGSSSLRLHLLYCLMMKFLSDKSANTFFPIILNHLVNVHTKR